MISGSRRNDSDLCWRGCIRQHYGIIGPNLCARGCVRQEVAILGLMEVNQLLAAAMFVDK